MVILRDKEGIAHVVSLSGGKDSTALAFGLMERMPDTPFNYVCTPTGNELPEMVEHWRNLEKILGQPIINVTNGTLTSIIAQEKMIPNWRSRFCTRILKLAAMARFLREASPAICYVGLRADEDEEDRGGATHGGDYITVAESENIKQRYPLREWGWNLKEVVEKCRDYQVRIPTRTDCAWCFYQGIGEWYNLWKLHPDIYEEGAAIERQFGHTFRSAGRDTWPAKLDDLRARFQKGDIPTLSLNIMAKRQDMCRACTL